MDDLISRQAAIETVRKAHSIGQAHRMLVQLPSVTPKQPGCVDAVPRTSVEYICRKNTVSTNPYEHKYHDKFIQFMDDPEISDFGRWKHSNGFNTALVAVKCDLDKVPSVTPKQPERAKWIGGEIGHCSVCGHEGCASDIWSGCKNTFCPNCGNPIKV